MKNKILTSLISLVAVICVLFGLFKISKLRTFQFFGHLVNRVETNQRIVALTFDDSPTGYSNQVVDLLEEKDIKATFYSMGENIEKYPQESKYIVDHGHELGNHSFSHHRMIVKSLKFIDEEIQKTNELIRESGYQGEITFRPPGCKKLFLLPWYLKKHGITTVTWDVEPDTYVGGDAKAIVQYTLEHTKNGSIILLHPFCKDACAADREALPQIIDGLKDRGFRFVTVSQLLGSN